MLIDLTIETYFKKPEIIIGYTGKKLSNSEYLLTLKYVKCLKNKMIHHFKTKYFVFYNLRPYTVTYYIKKKETN
jgi:hypothetical protein